MAELTRREFIEIVSASVAAASLPGCGQAMMPRHIRHVRDSRYQDDNTEVFMPVALIARFNGDVVELTEAYDRAHASIMRRGGALGGRRVTAPLRHVTRRAVHHRSLGI